MMLTYAEGRETVPALYYVRRMNRPDYSPELIDRSTGGVGESYPAYAADFERLLREKLAELFDPAVPFRATDDTEPHVPLLRLPADLPEMILRGCEQRGADRSSG